MQRQPKPTVRSLTAAAALLSLTASGGAPWVAAGHSALAPADFSQMVVPLADDANADSTVSEHELYRDRLLTPTFDVLSQQPGFQVGGLDPDVDKIVVYWNAEFGVKAQGAVDEAKSRGVDVEVRTVPYSYEELRVHAGRLVEALAAQKIELEGYRIGDPFDEIAVWGSGLDNSAVEQRTAQDIASRVLPTDLRIVFSATPPEVVPSDSRHADGGQPTPGGGYQHPLGGGFVGVCTSALGWEDPGFRFYMESAAHCVSYVNNESVEFEGNPNNAGTYSGYIATLVGNPNSLSSVDALMDATLIGVPATPSIAGEQFFGPNNSSSNEDIPSIGSIPMNTTLCANGAATGTHCNVVRTSSGITRLRYCGTCPYFDLVTAISSNNQLMWGEGDSGGSAYRLSNIRVVGTISAQNSSYTCGSVNYWSPTFLCTKTSGFMTDVSWVASELAETNPDLVPRLRP
jgi:hypothetical protein